MSPSLLTFSKMRGLLELNTPDCCELGPCLAYNLGVLGDGCLSDSNINEDNLVTVVALVEGLLSG